MIPVRYRRNSSSLMVNFDFVDVASGEGYITYYLYDTQTDGTIDYHMTNETFYGHLAKLVKSDGAQNYDTTEFNLPRVIKGTAIFEIAGNLTDASTITFTLYKVTGSTATSIGTGTANPAVGNYKITSRFSITTTMIKKGDILRLTLSMTGNNNNYVATDPTNRLTLGITKINLPFKIE